MFLMNIMETLKLSYLMEWNKENFFYYVSLNAKFKGIFKDWKVINYLKELKGVLRK